MEDLYGASLNLEKLFSRPSFYDIAWFSNFATGPYLDPATTSENILRIHSIDAIMHYLIADHLYGCFSCLRRL